jgi:hypothetical protein
MQYLNRKRGDRYSLAHKCHLGDGILFAANVRKPEYGLVVIAGVPETSSATASPTPVTDSPTAAAPAEDSSSSTVLENSMGIAGAVVLCVLVSLVYIEYRAMRRKISVIRIEEVAKPEQDVENCSDQVLPKHAGKENKPPPIPTFHAWQAASAEAPAIN